MVSISGIVLCLSFSQLGRQNGENRVWGGMVYPKCTPEYASMESGRCTAEPADKNWLSKPPGGDEQIVSVFRVILCLSFSQFDRQNSENQIGRALDHAPRTQNSLVLTVFDHFE